jgi:hydrogenase maturation protease
MRGMLVFGYGNPGRGDDALGPVFVERLERAGADAAGDIDCLTDMQLQVEHVMDLSGRRLLLFVDADASCPPPFRLSRIHAERDVSYTSHAMSPEALLYAYRQVYGQVPPPAYLLRIRGYGFALGQPLGSQAAAHLEAALALAGRLGADVGRWQRCADAVPA